jgi:Tfp pilus assembly PilM family ATPase
VKRLSLREPIRVLVEIRPTSFHARTAGAGVEVELERGPDGRLTSVSAANATAALEGLLARKPKLSPTKIYCAIGCRGVLLRPIVLPAAPPSEVPRLLHLHIEGEFPLPPEALAWGWMPLPGPAGSGATASRQEVLVAAVKREVIEEYAALLEPITADPLFTLAALARRTLVPADQPAFAVLDVGSAQSELTLIDPQVAPTVQVLPWGEHRLLEMIGSRLGLDRGAALAALEGRGTDPTSPPDPLADGAVQTAVTQLLTALPVAVQNQPLWISGPSRLTGPLARLSANRRESGQATNVLTVPDSPGITAATLGLEQSIGGIEGRTPLPFPILQLKPVEAPNATNRALPLRRIAVVGALLLAVLLFPYLEAILLQPRLARRLATLKAGGAQLATIDRELSFLRYLEQNQAPHLDAAYVIAQAAPSGIHLDSVSMNRHGEVSLNGYLRDLAQVGEFHLKLINSGFFSTVVVEDQSPTPDRQRINFRINAQWKDIADREALSLGPVLPDPAGGKTGASNAVAGTPPVRTPPTSP